MLIVICLPYRLSRLRLGKELLMSTENLLRLWNYVLDGSPIDVIDAYRILLSKEFQQRNMHIASCAVFSTFNGRTLNMTDEPFERETELNNCANWARQNEMYDTICPKFNIGNTHWALFVADITNGVIRIYKLYNSIGTTHFLASFRITLYLFITQKFSIFIISIRWKWCLKIRFWRGGGYLFFYINICWQISWIW